MDSTLFTIFLVLGLGVIWFAVFVIKHNRINPTANKPKSVRDELFGKKKKKHSKESWSIDQN
jgi:hypothetical protein